MAIAYNQNGVQLQLAGDGIATQFTVDVDDLPVGTSSGGANYLYGKVLGDIASVGTVSIQSVYPTGTTATASFSGRRIAITFSAPIVYAYLGLGVNYLSNSAPV